MEFIPVEVVGVRVEMPSNQPIVLLKETNGARYLPIWVGAVEATAIALAQQGMTPPRPMTHDLTCSIISALDTKLSSIYLTEIKEGVFYAQINLMPIQEKTGEKLVDGIASASEIAISARPSDAIALALRSSASILASSELLMEAGIDAPDQAEAEVERFKEFLDQIKPEDFGQQV